ncbi:MAG: endonuclease III domain-containing protein [Deltaproteobacteria bacterium]|jgi:endonuclease-3 related protein
MSDRLLALYEALLAHFGPQHWWPGDSPFEVMVGAVLTQNTNWQNVDSALVNLKEEGLLSLAALEALPLEALAEKIRPSGYYRLKAGRLKNLLAFIRAEYEGDLDLFFSDRLPEVREKLLAVKGIGPETADSILLYAAEKPVFVVDAYTHRILSRHGLIFEDAGYHEIQELFTTRLPEDVSLYNEYHALLVRLGKELCKKGKPLCERCPLAGF